MKSSGSYGEKLGYKLPHLATNQKKAEPPKITQDVYRKQDDQSE